METRTRILEAALRLLEQPGRPEVRMRDIAESAGISRQAVYLHFASRAELLVATTRYVDQIRGLDERLRRSREAVSGIERLDAFVEFWGRYIPEIYGVAKALRVARQTDEAAATAWSDRMSAVREGCRAVIEALQRDKMLAPGWNCDEATDLFWTLLSVGNWEQLTVERGWSTDRYIDRMKKLAKRSFVNSSQETRF